MRATGLVLGFLTVCAAVCVGCNGETVSDFKPAKSDGLTPEQRMDKQIKEIENNSAMPDSAKQMAIGQIKAHASMNQTLQTKK